MKKKVRIFIGLALFAVASLFMVNSNGNNSITFDNNKASASYCPNGCVANGDGCYCNDWFPCLKEYKQNQL